MRPGLGGLLALYGIALPALEESSTPPREGGGDLWSENRGHPSITPTGGRAVAIQLAGSEGVSDLAAVRRCP